MTFHLLNCPSSRTKFQSIACSSRKYNLFVDSHIPCVVFTLPLTFKDTHVLFTCVYSELKLENSNVAEYTRLDPNAEHGYEMGEPNSITTFIAISSSNRTNVSSLM